MNVQSWQIPCPRCGWANSGALVRCAKCGQPLGGRPGMLVAGQSQSHKAELPASTRVAKPGGFLPRLIALIVDSLILLVILFPIMSLWASQLAPAKLDTGASHSTIDTLRGSLSLQLTLLLLQVFYFAGSWTIMAATPGQLLMSLRVTDANAAGIGFMRALFRYVLFALFLVLAPVSALMVGLGKQKRALHDLLAGTYVIQVVDRDDLAVDKGLPATSSDVEETFAPPQGPRIPPDPLIAPAPPAVAGAAAYSPPRSRAAYSPPPSVPLPSASPEPGATSQPPQPAVPPHDFPPMPMGTSPDVPPPPGRRAGGGGMDSDLYAPPQMVNPSAPPSGPTDSTDGGTAPEHELPPMEFPPMAPPPDHHK